MDYGVALTLPLRGHKAGASIGRRFGKRFPEDTIVQFNYLPTLRAKLALSRANPQQALDILLPLLRMNLALPRGGFLQYWPNLYPSMCVEKPIWPRIRQRSRRRVPENSRPSR